MEELAVGGVTEVLVARGLPRPLLQRREGRQKAAVLTQPRQRAIADEVSASMSDDGLDVEIISLPDRDAAKSAAVVMTVYESLARVGLGRSDTIVGVGGGSVTDLSGFVAGTWMRGVESVNVPTTLLGAVDASVGGKTGFNLAGKNLVGVIWHPSRVIVDLTTLEALPVELRRDGLIESFKGGMVADRSLAELIAERGIDAPLEEVVPGAIRIKARIVEEDERDHGSRAFLNFGHTFGHAIEFSSALTHGEAVGLGMIAAAAISEKRHGFAHLDLVRSAVASLGGPVQTEGLDTMRVRELLNMDKKRDARGLRMVLLADIGSPLLEHVDSADVDAGFDAVRL